VYCLYTDSTTNKSKLYYNDSDCKPADAGEVLLKLDSTVYKNKADSGDQSGEFLVYKCDANECIQYTSNYYLHAFDDGKKLLYKCDTEKCSIQSSFSVGYYLTGPSSSELLSCTTADTASSCTSAVALKGIYINAGATDSVINCGSEKCQEASVTSNTCSKAGDLIKSGSDIKLCISNKADEAKKINPPSQNTYITFESGTTFPGSPSNKDFNIKLSTEGAVYLLEEAKISSCTVTDTSTGSVCLTGHTGTQYCITSSNKLLKTISSTCVVAVETAGNVFIGNDYKSVTLTTLNSAKYGYSCNGDSVCEIIKGYIIDSNIIKCSGWTGDPCIATAIGDGETCSSSTKDGELLSKGTKLCFGTKDYTLADTETILAFHLNDINSNYGMNKDDVVILSASKTKVIVTEIESSK